jgi:DNA-binding transcriptional ArsR family regulator
MARSSTTSDVFNAVAEARRREILDALITGEKAVGALVSDLSMSQPQVSKHLRVLSEVGLVSCRSEGRHRLYRLEPARLRPFHDWLAKYERAWNDRLDRMGDYLDELQQQKTGRVTMPTRAEILDTLATSQTQVMAFFRGLSPEELERPATASDVPGAAPWRAKDHLAHLAHSERRMQHLLRHALAGETRDALLRLQYPEGMPLPGVLGDLNALTAEELERMVLAVAGVNQADVDEHHDDSLETLAADYLAARQDTVDLLHRFTDHQLAAPVATVVADTAAGGLFAGRAEHAADHLTSIEEGLRQRV